MGGLVEFVRVQRADLPLPQAPTTIVEETYIVTGANTGLGYECTKHLFRMGAGRVILAVRSREKGEAALVAIQEETGVKHLGEVWELDLTSFDSVEAFAKRLTTLDRLDCLVANAGVAMMQYQLVQGIELSLLVNVVTTMLLGLRAIPKLQWSARKYGIHPRLVIVSSRAALDTKVDSHINKFEGNIFDKLSGKEDFNPMLHYPTTKLLEIYAVRHLASLLPFPESGVIVNTVSPGLCYSDLDRNASTIPKLGMAVMRKLLARTTEEGSRNLLQAAFVGPEGHGAYCSECQVKDHALPAWITNEDGQRAGKRVWEDLLETLESKGHGVDLSTL